MPRSFCWYTSDVQYSILVKKMPHTVITFSCKLTGMVMVVQISLELGGNAPCIIFDDANLEVAVKGTVSSV